MFGFLVGVSVWIYPLCLLPHPPTGYLQPSLAFYLSLPFLVVATIEYQLLLPALVGCLEREG